MLVGILIIDLYLPTCNSLKEKRSILKRLKDKVRGSFNVSISEIDELDIWRRAQLGVACISNNGKDANSLLSKVVNFIESEDLVEILDYKISFV
ncbi:MAG: DUF503 domain-containing protein [candidate division WOR-3 bacterium]